MKQEIPALWSNLNDILDVENSRFLPEDVSEIVLGPIKTRKETFLNAVERDDSDYIMWPNTEVEHPTQFCPNFSIFRHPKKYEVNQVVDKDFCEKVFSIKCFIR